MPSSVDVSTKLQDSRELRPWGTDVYYSMDGYPFTPNLPPEWGILGIPHASRVCKNPSKKVNF
jgi:hypothetical protein